MSWWHSLWTVVVVVVVVVVVIAASGCVTSQSVTCSTGLVCASGKVCNSAGDRCVFGAQLDDCLGKSDGDGCSYPTVNDGVCYGGTCIAAGCGNGVVEPGEVCDDGNRLSFDGCSAECTSSETCGDGILDFVQGEQCDCGIEVAALPDGCVGVNADVRGAVCRTDCRPARCGDGIVDPDEGCDDGNEVPGDGCRADCKGRWTAMASGTLEDLTTVWASGSSFAVAAGRYVYVWNGVAWTRVLDPVTDSGAGGDWNDAWGSGPDDVYMVRAGAVIHYDGTSWATVNIGSSGDWLGIWGSSSSDVWLVGQTASARCTTAVQCKAGPWTPVTHSASMCLGGCVAIAGSAANNIVAAGFDRVYRYNGAWALVSNTEMRFDSMYIRSSSDGWAIENPFTDTTPWRFTGTWSRSSTVVAFSAWDITGDAQFTFIAGEHYAMNQGYIQVHDGTGWRLDATDTKQLKAISSAGVGRAFAVGRSGTIVY